MEKEKKYYYVYAYLDSRKSGKYLYDKYQFNFCPFYIGKGSWKRDICHIEARKKLENQNSFFYNCLRKMIDNKKFPVIVRIEENLAEKQALQLEHKLVTIIGRRKTDTGPLTNMTDGGESSFFSTVQWSEISKNLWKTESYREKIIESSRNNWKIISPNNFELAIRDLAKWCKENNFIYSSCKTFSSRRVIYNGYCFINLDRDGDLVKEDFRLPCNYDNRKWRTGRSIYKIIFKNGEVKEFLSGELKNWCLKNNFNFSGVKTSANTNNFYKELFKVFYTSNKMMWKITDSSGNVEIIKNLTEWCNKKNLNVKKFRHYVNHKNGYCNDFKIEKFFREEKIKIKDRKRIIWTIIRLSDKIEIKVFSLTKWMKKTFGKSMHPVKRKQDPKETFYLRGYKIVKQN